MPLAMLLRPPKEGVRKTKDSRGGYVFLKSMRFWLTICSMNLWSFGSILGIVFFADYALENGMNEQEGSLLVTIMGLSLFITAVITAIMNKLIHISPIHAMNMGTVLRGSSFLLFPIIPKFYFAALCLSIYGAAFAIHLAMLVPCLTKITGVDQVQKATGVVIFSFSFGALIGPPFAGKRYPSLI